MKKQMVVFFDGLQDSDFISSTMSKINQDKLGKELNIKFLNTKKINVVNQISKIIEDDKQPIVYITNHQKEKISIVKNNFPDIELILVNKDDYTNVESSYYSSKKVYHFFQEFINLVKEEKGKTKIYQIENFAIVEKEMFVVDLNQYTYGTSWDYDREKISQKLIKDLEESINFHAECLKQRKSALKKELKTINQAHKIETKKQ